MLRTKMWIVFNSSITFTRWHERRSRPLNKLFACLCVCVCKCECVCAASSISIWRPSRKGEQGQTGGWACNGQRKWPARGRMTKPSSRSFYILSPPLFLTIQYTPSIVYLNCPQGPLVDVSEKVLPYRLNRFTGTIRSCAVVIESREK